MENRCQCSGPLDRPRQCLLGPLPEASNVDADADGAAAANAAATKMTPRAARSRRDDCENISAFPSPPRPTQDGKESRFRS